ncbi:LolA family protein [Parapedobacter sp. DT-150]|uniref:LolA family protein n=1 Tax=Parapedobacter sp. DT-150 TaxID=3396162 RepID=UPI003F1B35B3
MHKHRILIMIALVLCSVASAQQKALTAAEVALFKEKVTANTKNIRSLESDFTQTKQLSYVEKAITSSGKLYFKAPQQIRWEYLQPTRHVIVFDGQTMRVDAGADKKKQVDLTSNSRLNALSDLMVGTVQGGKILDDSRFDITYYREGTGYLARLIPKEGALRKYMKQVELTFEGTTFLLKRTKIIDPAADYTLITFEHQRKNATISEDKFTLK